MKKIVTCLIGSLLAVAGCDSGGTGSADLADLSGGSGDMPVSSMSFFITSETGSANLGGLAGADARCSRLATAAGVAGKRWAAYLSTYTVNGVTGVDARDRIGRGPWFNARGVVVASSVTALHDAMMTLNKDTALDEKGGVVNGRGDSPNQHDILTGSKADGRVDGKATCVNWTSEEVMGTADAGTVAIVGHHDRQGGGIDPPSWNAAHPSRGCSAETLVSTGGAGRFYCFAVE